MKNCQKRTVQAKKEVQSQKNSAGDTKSQEHTGKDGKRSWKDIRGRNQDEGMRMEARKELEE